MEDGAPLSSMNRAVDVLEVVGKPRRKSGLWKPWRKASVPVPCEACSLPGSIETKHGFRRQGKSHMVWLTELKLVVSLARKSVFSLTPFIDDLYAINSENC